MVVQEVNMSESRTSHYRLQLWQLPARVARVACGLAFSVAALETSGTVAWGSNTLGQCGISDQQTVQV